MSNSIFIRLAVTALPVILIALILTHQPASADPAAAAEAQATEIFNREKDKKEDRNQASKPAAGQDKKQAAAKRRARAQEEKPGKASREAAATVTVEPIEEEAADTAGETEKEAYVRKLSEEVTLLTLERDKLLAENAIAEAQTVKELTDREAATELIEMELEEIEVQMKLESLRTRVAMEKELADLRAEKERLVLNAEIAKAKTDAEINKFKLVEEERKSRLSKLTSEIAEKEKSMEREYYVERSPVYLKEPLEGKTLVISDRRIALNGLIGSETADYISERINFFNNKDQNLPIFIVIDYCPGGSVMSGYKILKSMEGSEAPVHVVVKSFAASMAACITTLADTSYAYPNALILHHQISGFSAGNLTQQREFVEEAEEWWRRLAGPVAEKMGISLDDFIDMMYENVSTGDWVEFGDEARKLKWVGAIIEEIRETSLVKNPDAGGNGSGEARAPYLRATEEQLDEDGKPFVSLPRLAPFDYYWLYNPDGYYR